MLMLKQIRQLEFSSQTSETFYLNMNQFQSHLGVIKLINTFVFLCFHADQRSTFVTFLSFLWINYKRYKTIIKTVSSFN